VKPTIETVELPSGFSLKSEIMSWETYKLIDPDGNEIAECNNANEIQVALALIHAEWTPVICLQFDSYPEETEYNLKIHPTHIAWVGTKCFERSSVDTIKNRADGRMLSAHADRRYLPTIEDAIRVAKLLLDGIETKEGYLWPDRM
jgi:hypothetical protein